MYARIFKPYSDASYFIFGPRGIDKTSSLRSLIPHKHKDPIIIDEIQRLPALLNEIHSQMNEEINIILYLLALVREGLSQGAVLNISNVSSDCGVPRKTDQTYFEILQDLLLAYRLPIFQKKSKRELIKHDKFRFF